MSSSAASITTPPLFSRDALHPAAIARADALARARAREGAPWCVAFSGGADSLALLITLCALFPAQKIVALHFNHRLRGADSDSDERFCRDTCASLGVEIKIGYWRQPVPHPSDPSDPSDSSGTPEKRAGAVARADSLLGRPHAVKTKAGWQPALRRFAPDACPAPSEAAAREARHGFFAGEMDALGARVLFLGHQRDDIAETQLMRLARGSGAAGLAAPRPVHARDDGRVFLRPLLTLTKKQITDALRARGLAWREDASNAAAPGDPAGDYFRNRIRRDVLPAWLAAAENDALAGAALTRELLDEDNAALDAWLEELMPAEALERVECVECEERVECGSPLPLSIELPGVEKRSAKNRRAFSEDACVRSACAGSGGLQTAGRGAKRLAIERDLRDARDLRDKKGRDFVASGGLETAPPSYRTRQFGCSVFQSGDSPPLDLRPLAGKPRALLRRALRRWAPAAGLARAGFEALLAVCESRSGAPARTSVGDGTAVFEKGILRLETASSVGLRTQDSGLRALRTPPFSLALADGARISGEVVTLTEALRARILAGEFSPADTVFITAPRPRTPLIVRAAQSGDRFQPLGAPGSAKLSDLFINRKIPLSRRATLPVVCVAARRRAEGVASDAPTGMARQRLIQNSPILWVPGLPPAEAVKIGRKTSLALRLTYCEGTCTVKSESVTIAPRKRNARTQ